MAWRIEYFETSDGRVPAAEFEDSINAKLKGKLNTFAAEAARSGGTIGGGIFEKCHGYSDLYEVRAKLGEDLGREFCTRDGDQLVMLHGCVKRPRTETPVAVFEEAATLLSEYKKTRRVAR
jgi:hypothetical protein